MTAPVRIAVCANQAWNLVNFRSDLIRALIDAGCAVHAIAPPDPAMEQRLAELGCTFGAVEMDAKGLSPLRDLKTFLALRREIRRFRPAAWLSWTIKPNIYGSLAAATAGVPALPNISGLGTVFIRRGLLTALATRLYRIGLRRAPVVFFQNETDRDEFVSNRLIRAGQARVLPGSGIDTERFAPPAGGRPAHRRFLMLARVMADKGVREFVAAARITKSRWPDARFILMGAIDAPNRTAIPRSEVESWIGEGVIEHLDPVSDVRPHIAASDFVVLPSYREGLSRVLVEAGAMGRPAIASDVPGCRDIIADGRNGFLCAPRSADALAEAFARAAACDDASWQAMADAARQRVLSEFSAERVIALYFAELAKCGVKIPGKLEFEH